MDMVNLITVKYKMDMNLVTVKCRMDMVNLITVKYKNGHGESSYERIQSRRSHTYLREPEATLEKLYSHLKSH